MRRDSPSARRGALYPLVISAHLNITLERRSLRIDGEGMIEGVTYSTNAGNISPMCSWIEVRTSSNIQGLARLGSRIFHEAGRNVFRRLNCVCASKRIEISV